MYQTIHMSHWEIMQREFAHPSSTRCHLCRLNTLLGLKRFSYQEWRQDWFWISTKYTPPMIIQLFILDLACRSLQQFCWHCAQGGRKWEWESGIFIVTIHTGWQQTMVICSKIPSSPWLFGLAIVWYWVVPDIDMKRYCEYVYYEKGSSMSCITYYQLGMTFKQCCFRQSLHLMLECPTHMLKAV